MSKTIILLRDVDKASYESIKTERLLINALRAWLKTVLIIIIVVFSDFTVLFSLPVAPPLSIDTLLPLLKEVKCWRTLAKKLIETNDDSDGFFSFTFEDSENLDDLQRQYGSDEECLKYVIEKYLQGKGGLYEQPSWRSVTQSLYEANEFKLASRVKSYGEPVQGVCIFLSILVKCD